MLGKLLPILLAAVGLGAGIGGGLALRPPPETPSVEMAAPCGEVDQAPDKAHDTSDAATAHDYVKLNNQFVVPVVEQGRVASLVVLSLSLEVASGETEAVYAREPKLRDAFLQVLFDHANAGGFEGAFTKSTRMTVLRRALLEVAQASLGPFVSDVLIIDMIRQDA